MFYNALTFDDNILKCAGSGVCPRINYAGRKKIDGVNVFTPVQYAAADAKNIYLSSLFEDDLVDKAIELTARGAKLILSCCNSLFEVGECDKKFGVTPIGLAHKYGLLDGALIAGATYLDKDDVGMIIQSGAEVVLLPSTSMGSGFGVPPVRMLLSLGATVRLGTGQPEYNRAADLEFEARLLSLAASGALCTKDVISAAEIKKLLGGAPSRA